MLGKWIILIRKEVVLTSKSELEQKRKKYNIPDSWGNWLTTKQIGDFLNIPNQTIIWWVQQNKLVGKKFGYRILRIQLESFLQFLDESEDQG